MFPRDCYQAMVDGQEGFVPRPGYPGVRGFVMVTLLVDVLFLFWLLWGLNLQLLLVPHLLVIFSVGQSAHEPNFPCSAEVLEVKSKSAWWLLADVIPTPM